MGWVGAVLGAMSNLTTTCRIAGAQPMFAVWPVGNGEAADGAGAWLGWPDGVAPVPVVPVGAGVAGAVVVGFALGPWVRVAVGVTVGVAAVAGLDGAVDRGAGVWTGVAPWTGVLAGAPARGDDGVPGADPPPLSAEPTGPAVGTVAKSPCS